jgi:glycosyltransferase 2 family protein
MNAELTATTKSEPRAKQVLKQLIGLALAGLFLWLAFRNTNFAELWQHMRSIDLGWVLLLSVVAVVSHWLRALRWTIMLKPLAHKPVSVWNAFCAVMIGYAVNIAVPRGGEVARVVSISKTENLPWVGVLPTMLIDRLLDIAMLVFLVGITMVMLPADIRESLGWLVPTGGALCLATIVGLALLPVSGTLLKRIAAIDMVSKRMPDKVAALVSRLADEFDRGTGSLRNPVGLPGIALLSFLIWGSYFLTFYIGLFAFHLERQIDLSRALIIFTMASVSMLVPTPGSLGTYHYAVSQSMQKISHIDPAQSTAFATVLHGVTFVLVICAVAAICFIVQQTETRRRLIKPIGQGRTFFSVERWKRDDVRKGPG